jgi:hypothetical protein
MLKVNRKELDNMEYTCYSKYIQTTRGPPLMLEIVIGYTEITVQHWQLIQGSVRYNLYVTKPITDGDARLLFINMFKKMEVKNGYGFGSPSPELKWEEHF